MRNFNQLDTQALRAFYYASEELNFTRAAKSAGLTQSGISQHVRKLEEHLGNSLFHRDRRKMRLSEAGRELRQFVELYLDGIESLMDTLSQASTSLQGTVRFAMPESCLLSSYYAAFLDRWAKDFPKISMKIRVHSSEEVVDLVLASEVDFGLLTKPLARKELRLEEIAREEYVLVGRSKWIQELSPLRVLKDVPFVGYYGMDSLFDQWAQGEFSKSAMPNYRSLSIRAEVDCMEPALLMVRKGFGLGIFPKHCVQRWIDSGELQTYRSRKSRAATSSTYLAVARGVHLPMRVQAVIGAFCRSQ